MICGGWEADEVLEIFLSLHHPNLKFFSTNSLPMETTLALYILLRNLFLIFLMIRQILL